MNVFVLILPWTLVLSLLLENPVWIPGLNVVVAACLLLWCLSVVPVGRLMLSRVRPVLIAVVAAGLGWQLAALAHSRFAPWPLQTQTVYEVEGQVEGLPDVDRYGTRVRLRVQCVSSGDSRCNVYQGDNNLWPILVDVTAPHKKWPQPPLPGQIWQFRAHPVPPSLEDPNSSFNLARWLKASHVVARFRMAAANSAVLRKPETAPVQMARLLLRETMVAQQGQASRAGLSGLPVVLALITGDRSLMTQEHWRIFNNTGTTHLIAISGAHIMLVAGVVVWLLNLLLKRFIWLTNRIPSLQIALLLGWLVALGYGVIAGLGFPVQRALIMLSLLVLFKLWGRAQPLWLAWNLAFLLVLIWDPMAVFSIGFWLSFVAVYWILWMSGGSVLPVSKARMWWRVQMGIFLGLAPVLLWQLQNLSLVSGGTNLFAIPLVGLILTPLSLVWALCWGVVGDAANGLLVVARWLAEAGIFLLQWCADTPFSVLNTTPHDAGAMLLALLGVAWLCTAGLPARGLAPLLCLPLLLPAPPQTDLQIMAGESAPRIVLDTGDQLLMVTRSEWPWLESRWQQNLLRFKGIGLAPPDTPVEQAAAYWQAPYWSLTALEMTQTWLGTRRIVRQSFTDLCAPPNLQNASLQWQMLLRNAKGDQCAVLLVWQGQRILLITAMNQREQRELLATLKQMPAIPRVLFHPRKQDRLLPELLGFWRQEGAQLMVTAVPSLSWQHAIDASGLPLLVLAESGPVTLAPASP